MEVSSTHISYQTDLQPKKHEQKRDFLEEGAIAASCGGEKEFEILVKIHKLHAKYLQDICPETKETRQAKAVFDVACTFQTHPPKLDSLKVQSYISEILKAYEPECLHTAYLTERELQGVDTFFNANQRFYAEWCDITSRAMVPLMKERSFKRLLPAGSYSRAALAIICKTPKTDQFGLPRKECVESYLRTQMYGPGCDQNDTFSKLLFDLVYSEWLRDSSYSIKAVGKDGRQVPGTTFYRNDAEGPDKVIFYWIHGSVEYVSELEAMCQEWLEEAMRLGEQGDDEEFFYAAGAFYHTLMQYSPYCRGSATFALQTIPALFLACKKAPPHATFMLDVYTLSMQQDDFIRHVFIPWCKGRHSFQEIMKHLHETFKDRIRDAPKLV